MIDAHDGPRSKKSGPFAVLCALALVAVTLPSFADAYEAALSRALVAKERALDSNDPADWAEALRLFLEADALKHTKVTAYEAGVAAARLRVDDLAVEAYESSLSLGLEGSAHDKAQAFVDANAPTMARLDIAGPPRTKVTIDGWRRGVLPLVHPLVVFAGVVRVHLETTKKTIDEDVTTKAGETAKLDVMAELAEAPLVAPSASASAAPSASIAVAPVPTSKAADDRAVGWTFLGAGLGVAVLSTTAVIVAGSAISSHRSALAGECVVPAGADSCTTTYTDLQASAQSDVDAIARWKTVRTVGWIGVGLGAASAVYGLVRLLGASGSSSGSTTGAHPTFGLAANGVSLGVAGAF